MSVCYLVNSGSEANDLALRLVQFILVRCLCCLVNSGSEANDLALRLVQFILYYVKLVHIVQVISEIFHNRQINRNPVTSIWEYYF